MGTLDLEYDHTARLRALRHGVGSQQRCLFSKAHRYFTQFAGVEPLLIEALLVPFHVDGQAVGTVWVVAHDENRKFDGEDQRVLEDLSTFAATAYQVLRDKQTVSDSERHFRHMIDALPAAIYTTDAKGRLTHFNPACVEFSGRTPELGSDHWCVTWKLYLSRRPADAAR